MWPLSRNNQDALPGTIGNARIEHNVSRLLRRIEPGDIAIIDEPDLTQAAAEELLAAGVVAVVNVAPALSDRYPTYGLLVLLQAGVVVLDKVDATVIDTVKDGKKISVHNGEIWYKGRIVAHGTPLTLEEISARIESTRSRINEQLAAFAGNTAEFLNTESPLLLEGMGVPDVSLDMSERKVIIVADNDRSAQELSDLMWFIRQHRPLLIGVDGGADILREAGYEADLLVGDSKDMSNDVFTGKAQLVLPAAPDGHTDGIERVQDLGVSAITFPAVAQANELALLLADYGGASLIVTVGMTLSLHDFLEPESMEQASAPFLTRLKVSQRLVTAESLRALEPATAPSWWAILLMIISLCFAGLCIYLYGFPQDAFASSFIHGWNSFVETIQGWFC